MESRVSSLLEEAFLREAERAARCEIYARVAEEEGRARMADLLRANGRGALEHARGLLTYMGEVGTSQENLSHLSRDDMRSDDTVFHDLTREAGDAWQGALAEYCERVMDAKVRARAEMESALETLGPVR